MNAATQYLRTLQLAHYNPGYDKINLSEEVRQHTDYERYIAAHAEKLENRITEEQNPSASIILDVLQKEILIICQQRKIDLEKIKIPLMGSVASANHMNCVKETAAYFSSYLLYGNPLKVPHKLAMTPGPLSRFSYLIYHIMQMFVMGHEWGHLLYGHLDGVMTERQMMSSMEVELLLKNHDDEYAADLVGVMFCANYLPKENIPFAFLLSCDIFFWYLEIFERSMSTIDKGIDEPIRSPTHPPATLRKGVIDFWVSEYLTPRHLAEYLLFRDNLERLCKPHFDYTIEQMWEHRRQGKMLHLQMH